MSESEKVVSMSTNEPKLLIQKLWTQVLRYHVRESPWPCLVIYKKQTLWFLLVFVVPKIKNEHWILQNDGFTKLNKNLFFQNID